MEAAPAIGICLLILGAYGLGWAGGAVTGSKLTRARRLWSAWRTR